MPKTAPIEVFTTSIARDLHILFQAVEGLRRYLDIKSITVATARANFRRFRHKLGSEVALLDEDEMVPTMRLAELRKLPQFRSSGGLAGWYLQQFLKFAYGTLEAKTENYLVWDADTVLLRPIDLFDETGRTWFTIADEYAEPYFTTYRRLFGCDAHREFSFITQHIVIDREVLREMLAQIEANCDGDGRWPWKIIQSLGAFSEYETYGHYFKSRHGNRAAYRRLPWTRDGALYTYYPNERTLKELGERYVFAAFEARQSPGSRMARYIRRTLKRDGPLLPAFLRRIIGRDPFAEAHPTRKE